MCGMRSLVSLALLVALAVSCDDNDLVASPSVEVPPSGEVVSWRPPRLDGRAFILVSQQGAPVLESAKVLLSFASPPQFQLKACNYLEGKYELRDAKLVLTLEATSTMGCTEQGSARDEWLQAFFTKQRPAVEISGKSLVLQTDLVRLVFAEQKAN